MLDKAKAYSREKHRLAIINIILSPAILFLLILSGAPTYLKTIVESLSSNNYVNLILFSAIIGAVYYVLMLPVSYYSGFILEHRFSLSNQGLKAWLKKEVKRGAVSFVIGIPLILSLFLFLRHWVLYWWILTGLLWFFLSICLSKFAPLLIVPLFYKYSAIKNIDLRKVLVDMARRVGFKIKDVYEINISKDTKKANAALMGLGKQKRIVLSDTLLKNFNKDEICSVMAHELGHHKLRHTLKLILFGGLSIILTFFITNVIFLKLHGIVQYGLLYDLDSLVLVYAILSALNILTLPIHNAFSRRLERSADRFSLDMTNNRAAFIQTMKKLADQNLADPDPGRFYEVILYNHPPISRRIAFAESYKRRP